VVDGNGEIVTITPPIKSSSTTLKVTIKWKFTLNN
jgi:hypothetical protein